MMAASGIARTDKEDILSMLLGAGANPRSSFVLRLTTPAAAVRSALRAEQSTGSHSYSGQPCPPTHRSLAVPAAVCSLANRHGHTAVHAAALAGKQAALTALIGAGADAHATSDKGQTAMLLACMRASTSIVKYLQTQKADIWKADHNGQTALHYAVLGGNIAMAKVLHEELGIGVNIPDGNGRTVLHHAVLRPIGDDFGAPRPDS